MYFTKLFDSQGVTNAMEVLNTVTLRVGPEINEELSLPFLDEEIKHALFQMHHSGSGTG